MIRIVNLPKTLQGVAFPGLCVLGGFNPGAHAPGLFYAALPGLKTADINTPNFRDEPVLFFAFRGSTSCRFLVALN